MRRNNVFPLALISRHLQFREERVYRIYIAVCLWKGTWISSFPVCSLEASSLIVYMLLEQSKMDAFLIRFFQTPTKVDPQSKTRYRLKEEKSFHKSMAFVLILAQCFGQLPIQGVVSADVQALHFKWKSWRTLYSILICIGATFISLMQITKLLTRGMNLFEISKSVLNNELKLIVKLQIIWCLTFVDWPRLSFS